MTSYLQAVEETVVPGKKTLHTHKSLETFSDALARIQTRAVGRDNLQSVAMRSTTQPTEQAWHTRCMGSSLMGIVRKWACHFPYILPPRRIDSWNLVVW